MFADVDLEFFGKKTGFLLLARGLNFLFLVIRKLIACLPFLEFCYDYFYLYAPKLLFVLQSSNFMDLVMKFGFKYDDVLSR